MTSEEECVTGSRGMTGRRKDGNKRKMQKGKADNEVQMRWMSDEER